jgi:hypothetical protein
LRTATFPSFPEGGAIERKQVPDPFDLDVGRRIHRARFRIVGVMAFAGKNGRDAAPQVDFTAARMRSLSSISR